MTRSLRWIALGPLILIAAICCVIYFGRSALWIVELTCLFDHKTTGLPFPCLEVDERSGSGRGVAILRAPFERSHIVVMPIVRVTGVEDPSLVEADSPNYFKAAWEARHFVQSELKHSPAGFELGMAVNSKVTRSQDQLHIHVDCVKRRIRLKLAEQLPLYPLNRWQRSGLVFEGLSYWVMRMDDESFEKKNVFRLVQQVPGFEANMFLTNLAFVSVANQNGGQTMVLLVAQSDPRPDILQSTSEDLLDHACRQ
jgi:CDP-diacylglycerol pyrophosphatase